MTLREKIESLAASRGKTASFALPEGNVTLQDNSDGLGPFIAAWNETALGRWPAASDGFTAEELRASP